MNVRRRLAAAGGLLAGAGLSLGLLLSGVIGAPPAAAAAAPPEVCVGTSNGQGWNAYCVTLPAL